MGPFTSGCSPGMWAEQRKGDILRHLIYYICVTDHTSRHFPHYHLLFHSSHTCAHTCAHTCTLASVFRVYIEAKSKRGLGRSPLQQSRFLLLGLRAKPIYVPNSTRTLVNSSRKQLTLDSEEDSELSYIRKKHFFQCACKTKQQSMLPRLVKVETGDRTSLKISHDFSQGFR